MAATCPQHAARWRAPPVAGVPEYSKTRKAASAFASADQIGTQTTQIQAILADPHWHGGDYAVHGTSPQTGLGIARRIAHLTYRTEDELATSGPLIGGGN